MYLWELFGLDVKSAAKVAGTLTWLIRKKTTEGDATSVAEIIKSVKKTLNDFSDNERALGWYLMGNYILSAAALGSGDVEVLENWYNELYNVYDNLEDNIKKYEWLFSGNKK